jgi:hypothetical protein
VKSDKIIEKKIQISDLKLVTRRLNRFTRISEDQIWLNYITDLKMITTRSLIDQFDVLNAKLADKKERI